MILSILLLIILYLSFKKISKYKKTEKDPYLESFQRAWFTSFLIFFLSHLVDIQYFDVRISLLCWIFLAGLKSFIEEKSIDEQDNILFK